MKIQNKNIWITSDTHYAHKNICKATSNWVDGTRDFDSLDNMNATIVNNINKCAKAEDILIFCGDWSFGGFENIKKFYDNLICKNIHFVYGNHDHHIINNKENIKSLFLSTQHYLTLEAYKINFILMHYPISSWEGLSRGSIHLHGHTHLEGEKRFGRGKRMDIGIDGQEEFRPYNLMDEVVPLMKNRDNVSEFNFDHHNEI